MRRALLLAPLLMMACTEDPVTDYLGGAGDPVRGASLWATRNLGDTARWDGDPGGAAMAAAQLEFLDRSYRDNPIWAPGTSVGTLTALAAGRREMRAWLGIGEAAPALAVETQLRAASLALRQGKTGRAEAALSGPDFTLGAAETLRRLADLPRMPAVAWAAGAVGEEIARRSWPRT